MDKRVESSPRFPGKLQIIGKLRLESWIQFVTSFHEILIPLIELREARAGKVQRVHTNFGSSGNSRIVHTYTIHNQFFKYVEGKLVAHLIGLNSF